MAKGDKNKQQTAVNTAVDTSRRANNDLTNQMIVPTTQSMYNNYQSAAGQQMQDYRDLMDAYKNYSSTAPGASSFERVNYQRSPELAKAMAGYGNFADTGGYSQQDIADMRARGVSPIRSTYANMINELQRQKNLQGGYSPNMAAAMTRMRGSTSQQMADQVQNINAQLAEAVNRGKLAGLEGLGGLSVQDLNFGQQAQLANQRAGLETNQLNATAPYANPRLAALNAASNLFGTSPGMAGTFGNQLLGSTQNWLGANNQGNDVGRMGITGQQIVSQTPSNFETGLNRASQIAGIGASVMSPFMGGYGSSILPGGRASGAMQTYNQFPGGIRQNSPYSYLG